MEVGNQISFEEIVERYWAFAEKCFDTKPEEATRGLLREAKELDHEFNKECDDEDFEGKALTEMADCIFYIIYIFKRQGFSLDTVIKYMDTKLEVLKKRKWKKDETGCFSHVKEETVSTKEYKYNPPAFTEGHNPFGRGGVYSPGDPGL